MPIGQAPAVGPVTGTITDFSPSAREDIDNVYTVKWADINATASGDTTVVSLVSGKKIRVLQMGFSVSAAVNIAWKSGASTTKIAARSFPADGGHETGRVDPGWVVETDSGDALVINLSTAVNVRGQVNYIEV